MTRASRRQAGKRLSTGKVESIDLPRISPKEMRQRGKVTEDAMRDLGYEVFKGGESDVGYYIDVDVRDEKSTLDRSVFWWWFTLRIDDAGQIVIEHERDEGVAEGALRRAGLANYARYSHNYWSGVGGSAWASRNG